MNEEQKKVEEICEKAFIILSQEEFNKDVKAKSPEVVNAFPISIVEQKLDAVGIKVIIPDLIYLILATCCNSNPGSIQVMVKELLMQVKENNEGKIPEGYVVTALDFAITHPMSFPYFHIPSIEKKYHQLWTEQKQPLRNNTLSSFSSDNKCDTAEWWLEIIE